MVLIYKDEDEKIDLHRGFAVYHIDSEESILAGNYMQLSLATFNQKGVIDTMIFSRTVATEEHIPKFYAIYN